MRKIKLAMYVSVDGVVENPAWTGPYFNDELSKMQYDYLFSSDALLLGRVTYEGFAASWPHMEEATGDFGVKMNRMPKYVASRTLQSADWNATILKGDLATAVRDLKNASGEDVLIYGSGSLVDDLTKLGLIDEFRMMVHPIIVGTGKRFDISLDTSTPLELTDSRTTSTGVSVLTYTLAQS